MVQISPRTRPAAVRQNAAGNAKFHAFKFSRERTGEIWLRRNRDRVMKAHLSMNLYCAECILTWRKWHLENLIAIDLRNPLGRVPRHQTEDCRRYLVTQHSVNCPRDHEGHPRIVFA
jgi:hypothetical protein